MTCERLSLFHRETKSVGVKSQLGPVLFFRLRITKQHAATTYIAYLELESLMLEVGKTTAVYPVKFNKSEEEKQFLPFRVLAFEA